jgi:signal peptidase II
VKRILLIISILAFTVGCDQITKVIARNSIEMSERIEVVGSLLIFTRVENNGAFLGMGSNWPAAVRSAVFGVFSGCVVIAALIYLFRDKTMKMSQTIAFSLIAGGGIGNMIDRIAYGGRVTDFANIGIGKIRTGVFNMADLFLMIGLFLFLVTGLKNTRNDRDKSSLQE